MHLRGWLILFVTGAVSLMGTQAIADDVPLIPREVLFGNPDKAAARISPDGKQLAFLAPLEGVLNVWVGPADMPEAAKPVTFDKGRGIQQYFWAFTNRHIIYVQDKAGEENWRVYSVNLETSEVKDLTPLEGVNAQVQEVSYKHPTEILVGLNDRVPQLHDVYRVNIETGERTLLFQNPGLVGVLADDEYRLRFGFAMKPDGSLDVVKATADGGWEPFMSIPEEDVMTSTLVGFNKTGDQLWALDSRGRNTAALVRMDAQTGATVLIAEDERCDIAGAIVHPTEKTVQAVETNYLRPRLRILDRAIAPDIHYLRSLAQGDLAITSRSLDDRRWTVALIPDNGPVRYYLYDRRPRKARFLFTNRKDLEGLPLARMRPVVIPTRDGLNMVSYVTLPLQNDPHATGRPDKPLPMVLFVHGGPWGRDEWGYNPVHQLLANRGYAALSVNFRGSTGFGKAFINASTREWGGKMHDDLIDAVHWAIEQGIADPRRICIAGGSYGGYATLVGMTFTPEVFACGLDLVGPSNLVTFLQTVPPYWQPVIDLMKRRVGDFTTEEGRAFLMSRSPITRVHQIRAPLLIGQGANDPRVKRAESEQIVKAMQEKGLPVTYVVYSDEGHGFVRPENNLSFFAISEVFLAQHLGGRYEPIGDALKNSSLEVPAGAEHIPGLKEALKGHKGE